MFNQTFGFFFCKVAWQKHSPAFVFVMAKVTKTTSFLPLETWLLQNITFYNKPLGSCARVARSPAAAFPHRAPAALLPGSSSLLRRPKPQTCQREESLRLVFDIHVTLARRVDWPAAMLLGVPQHPVIPTAVPVEHVFLPLGGHFWFIGGFGLLF